MQVYFKRYIEPFETLTDEIEETPILDFEQYSDTLVKMSRSSTAGFRIGILENGGQEKQSL